MSSHHRSDRLFFHLSGITLLLLSLQGSTVFASDPILMRANCAGSVVTRNEGELAGYVDYLELSSVHHELSISIQPPGPLASQPVRVVKPVSASSVRLIGIMAQGQVCEEVDIVHLRPSGLSGTLAEYWSLQLVNTSVSERKHWDVNGAASVQDAISFNPEVATWIFTDGGGNETEFGWNFNTNSPAGQGEQD